MGSIDRLLNSNIIWLRDKSKDQPIWIAVYEGKKIILVMNDFPDEPLYTLFDGDDRLDLDDSPSGWEIPF